jgi:hypothetical protein
MITEHYSWSLGLNKTNPNKILDLIEPFIRVLQRVAPHLIGPVRLDWPAALPFFAAIHSSNVDLPFALFPLCSRYSRYFLKWGDPVNQIKPNKPESNFQP